MGLLCLDSRQMTIWFDFLKDELEKEEACFYFINQCRIFKTDQSYYFYQKNLQYLQDRVHSLTTKKLEYIYRRRFNFIFIFVTLAMNQLNLWTQLVPTKKKKKKSNINMKEHKCEICEMVFKTLKTFKETF